MPTYNGKGYTGLANLGNTCFLNSCLQVLNHTHELNELLIHHIESKTKKNKQPKSTKKPALTDETLLTEWIDLHTLMWSHNGIISPNKFVHTIQQLAKKKGKELFTGWAQNDMSEFLLFMIDTIHNSMARGIHLNITGSIENPIDKLAASCYEMLKTVYEKEFSEIMTLYYAISVSVICSIDGTRIHSIKPENYFILDLPISQTHADASPSIYDCFDTFTTREVLEGDNAWFNESTGEKEDIQKYFTFWNFPKILVVTFQRFSPCGQFKNQENITFPLTDLDLSKYVAGYNSNKYVYDLFGVCNHSGNVYGGHYTAFVLNAKNEWIHYNDTNVEILQSTDSIVSPYAYCLFYRKKNT
jgi:ubiquitin C-terminal hydrolase